MCTTGNLSVRSGHVYHF